MVTAQSLALAAVVSRLYINMKDSNATSLKDIIRYDQTADRYLVLTPCPVAFFAPVLVYQLDLYLITFETREMFFGLIVASIAIGLALYEYERD